MSLENTPGSKTPFNFSADPDERVNLAVNDLLADKVIEPLLRKGVISRYNPTIRLPDSEVARSAQLAEKSCEILSRTNGAYKAVRIDAYFTPRGGSYYSMTFCREEAPAQKPLTGFRKWWDDFTPNPRPIYIVP
ncbi:MAG TPA: hypothetical protein VGD95_03705 [Micavibrio sp.]